MRHRVKTRQFDRDTKQRKALLRGLVRSLLEQGSITTTKQKAKEVKRWADKLIGKAKTDTISVRRQLHTFFGKRDVVNTLVDRVAPSMGKRVSGFTTIKNVGKRRGDNAEMVTLELIEMPDRVGTLKSDQAQKSATKSKKSSAKKTSKPARRTTKKEAQVAGTAASSAKSMDTTASKASTTPKTRRTTSK